MTDLTTAQGFGLLRTERLPLPAPDRMTAAQRASAEALINSPRKGVKGPFIALMQSPPLLDRVAKFGEYLRFESTIEPRINEFVTAIVARHVGNQFEWAVHRPLAQQAGVAASVLEAVSQGARPAGMKPDEALAHDFAQELLRHNGVCDATYARAVEQWSERGMVELSALIGYFVCISWIMNVARTPAPAVPEGGMLGGFPR